ncbi:MAG: guanylate kinase [Betaproteobacteria bacterium]|nr:guanylate kinase [Betaproteobacteria bacterium]
MTGNVWIVTAPSGAGKTSLVRAMLERDRQICLSVSHTTRAPRPGERDGQDYHFVDETRFMTMLEAGEFLESAEVYGNRYGTSERWIRERLAEGIDVLLEIDWQGAQQVRRLFPQAIGVFILPPSIEVLRERLRNRGQDDAATVARRLAAARSDISHAVEFDYVIINDHFETALTDLLAVVRAHRLRAGEQLQRHAILFASLNA